MPTERIVANGRAVFILLCVMALSSPPTAPAALGDCGQPLSTGGGPTASDALAILRSAVGSATACDANPVICDANGDDAVTATDSLLTLRVAVGENLQLPCKWMDYVQNPVDTALNPPSVEAAEVADEAPLKAAILAYRSQREDNPLDQPWYETSKTLQPGEWAGVSIPAAYFPEPQFEGDLFSMLAVVSPMNAANNPDVYTWAWDPAISAYRAFIRGTALAGVQEERDHLFAADLNTSESGVVWVYADPRYNNAPVQAKVEVFLRPRLSLRLPTNVLTPGPVVTNKYAPETIPVTAVMDNSLDAHGVITLFDGTVAAETSDPSTCHVDLGGGAWRQCTNQDTPGNALLGYPTETPLVGINYQYNPNETGYVYYDEHTGYDFVPLWPESSLRVPVRAAAGGNIEYTDNEYNEVIIYHGDGYATHYLHMIEEPRPSWYNVNDPKVGAGYIIGHVGKTGAAGAHLHFTVKDAHKPSARKQIDPYRTDARGYNLWARATNCPANSCCPAALAARAVEMNCADGADNDCDASTDCADIDCEADPACNACAGACGNGIYEEECGEACDGSDLDGETCQSQGFACSGGELGCNGCEFNTAACIAACCGDGACNGSDTCVNCAADCGACPPSCGNGVVEAGEECDGADVDGESCDSQGFDCGGMLGCAGCQFTFGGCISECCGDDDCSADESCSSCATDCGTCPVAERITNGGFESGNTGWSAGAKPGGSPTSAGIVQLSYPHSGSRYAYLGDLDGAFDAIGSVHQVSISIPDEAKSAILTFWLNVSSKEGNGVYDKLDVNLRRSSNDSLLEKLATYSNQDKTLPGNYSKRTLNLDDYIGDTFTLQFYVDTDGDLETIFRIDDVSIMVDY